MAKKESDYFIGTYAKIILSDWPMLAELVSVHTQLIKHAPEQEKEVQQFNLLSERQITDAIKGPYQAFFKQKMIAYAAISRLQLELTVEKEEVFKEKRTPPETKELPKKLVEKFSFSDLDNIRSELDQLTSEHDQQWKEYIQQWQGKILSRINEIGITLTEIEIKEFKDQEPISELYDRFVNLHIELPKTKKNAMNFQKYFTYKIYLIIHSALSRQHRPHQQEDIKKILKLLKSDLDAIRKEEKQILADQKQATDKLIEPIAFASPKIQN